MAKQGSAGNVIAALCSLFIPGLGQLLQGRVLLAAVQFVLAAISWFVLMGWVVHLWSVVSAAKFTTPPKRQDKPQTTASDKSQLDGAGVNSVWEDIRLGNENYRVWRKKWPIFVYSGILLSKDRGYGPTVSMCKFIDDKQREKFILLPNSDLVANLSNGDKLSIAYFSETGNSGSDFLIYDHARQKEEFFKSGLDEILIQEDSFVEEMAYAVCFGAAFFLIVLLSEVLLLPKWLAIVMGILVGIGLLYGCGYVVESYNKNRLNNFGTSSQVDRIRRFIKGNEFNKSFV